MCTGVEILLLAGAALSAAAAVQSGQATKAQSKLQAGIARQQADRARLQAASDEEDFRRNQSRALSKRRAALGASGVDQAAGSPLLVGEDFASEVELNALRIRGGGEVRATRLEQEASLLRLKGRQAATSGFIRGGSLLISGAGQAFGSQRLNGKK